MLNTNVPTWAFRSLFAKSIWHSRTFSLLSPIHFQSDNSLHDHETRVELTENIHTAQSASVRMQLNHNMSVIVVAFCNSIVFFMFLNQFSINSVNNFRPPLLSSIQKNILDLFDAFTHNAKPLYICFSLLMIEHFSIWRAERVGGW